VSKRQPDFDIGVAYLLAALVLILIFSIFMGTR